MSDFLNKNQDELDSSVTETEESTTNIFDEESTVFSAPPEHKKRNPKEPFVIFGIVVASGMKNIIAAILAVAILVGGTLAVIKFIPEMTGDEAPASPFEDITVIETDSTSFTSVTVENPNGSFKFVNQEVSVGNGQSSNYWTIEGVEHSKLNESAVSNVISSAADLVATSKVDKELDECGFGSPTAKVTVTSKEDDPYTFVIGAASLDSMGYYLNVEGEEQVYLTRTEEFSAFEFSLLDISDTSPIPATVFSSDTTENKEVDGSYAYFDSLTFSGKRFPETVTIQTNSGKTDTDALVPYIVTTPEKRFAKADSLSSPIALFSSTSAISGNYALDITDETLKLFGLDDPDVVVTLTVNGEPKTFKFSLVDQTHCAIIYDGATMIRKGIITDFEFLSYDAEDFYFPNLFMNSINDITGLVLDAGDNKVEFGISYEEDAGENKIYHITANGKDISAKNFQNYYKDFVNIECSDFKVENVTGTPNGTITFKYYEGDDQVVAFYKVNETEYQYSIAGTHLG